MGKYDHICELTGTENYEEWRRQMILALRGERLWTYCSSGTDPSNFLDFATSQPVPVNPTEVTEDELERIRDWFSKDAQAKVFIDRKISPVVRSLLGEDLTARQQWELLASYYSRNDLLSQFELRRRVRSEKLRDAEDASRYIGVFEAARRRFIRMGVAYSTHEAIFDLLEGLPDGVEWENLRELTMDRFSLSLGTAASPTPGSSQTPVPTFGFDDAVKLLVEKAKSITSWSKLYGPRSPSGAAPHHRSTPQQIEYEPPAEAVPVDRSPTPPAQWDLYDNVAESRSFLRSIPAEDPEPSRVMHEHRATPNELGATVTVPPGRDSLSNEGAAPDNVSLQSFSAWAGWFPQSMAMPYPEPANAPVHPPAEANAPSDRPASAAHLEPRIIPPPGAVIPHDLPMAAMELDSPKDELKRGRWSTFLSLFRRAKRDRHTRRK